MPFQLCRLWVGYWHSVGSLVQILNRIWTKCKIQTNSWLLWTRGSLKNEIKMYAKLWGMQVWNSWILAFVRIWDCPRGHLVAFRCSGPCASVFQYSVLWCQFGITVVLWLLQLCPFSRTWVVLDASHRHLSPWTNGGGGAWNETQYKNENTSPDCKRLPFPFSFSLLDKFST